MDRDKLQELLGTATVYQINDKSPIALNPIRLMDWPDFLEKVFVLQYETLLEIYVTKQQDLLSELLLIVLRNFTALPDFINDMTQKDYAAMREIIMAQNNIDFDKFLPKEAKDPKKKVAAE